MSENCALLGHYATNSGNFGTIYRSNLKRSTCRQFLLVPSS